MNRLGIEITHTCAWSLNVIAGQLAFEIVSGWEMKRMWYVSLNVMAVLFALRMWKIMHTACSEVKTN